MGKVGVFFHGRPQGQKFWSNGDLTKEDSSYLEPFLDSKIGSDVSSAMIIDCIKGNAYYTFVVRKNVIEKERGTEAYFAITLKLEMAFCKNVSKLYQLLSLVFAEKCENALFLKVNSGMRRYSINGFDEIDGVLSEARNVLISNFEKVISQYVVPLTANSGTSRSNSVTRYSLKEADSAIFFEDCSTCKVVVSADYPRRDIGLQHEIKKLEQEKAHAKEEADKKSSLLQNQLTDKQQELDRAINQGHQLGLKVQELQSKLNSLSSAEDDIKRLKKEVDDYKNQYNKKKKELDQAERSVKDLKQQLEKKNNSTNERTIDNVRHMADRFQGGSETGYPSCPKYRHNDNKKVWANWVVIVVFSLLIVFGAISATFSLLTYSSRSDSSSKSVNQEMQLKQTIQPPPLQKPVPHPVCNRMNGEQGYKIDVAGKSSEWKLGRTANLTLKKADVVYKDVEWAVSGNATIEPNSKSTIRFTGSGSVTVDARIIGDEVDTVVRRNFDVN